MRLNTKQAVAILLMNKRKRRVLRKQLTPGPIFLDDYGDLSAHTLSDDLGNLALVTAFEDWNWSS